MPGATEAGLPASAAERSALGPSLRPAAGPVAVDVAATARSARLPDGELGRLPLRHVPFGARKGRADQSPMHGAVVVHRLGIAFGGLLRRLWLGLFHHGWSRLGGGSVRRRRGRRNYPELRCRLGRICEEDAGWLRPAKHRNLGLFVLVVCAAGAAASLPHLVFNHRDDHVVRDAALARTVVVENVTEPKPALLHEIPPEPFLSGGMCERPQVETV